MDVNWPKQILAWTWLLSWLISNRSKHCLNIYFKAIANLDKNVASYGQLERLLIFCLNFADNKARNKQGMAFFLSFFLHELKPANSRGISGRRSRWLMQYLLPSVYISKVLRNADVSVFWSGNHKVPQNPLFSSVFSNISDGKQLKFLTM